MTRNTDSEPHSFFRVISQSGDWVSGHQMDRVGVVSQLLTEGSELVSNCVCEIDDLSDDQAISDSFRHWRKGDTVIVESKGKLPYGNEIKFVHTSRYGPNYSRITTDVTIPRQTVIRQKVGVGSLFFPGKWLQYRLVGFGARGNVTISRWYDIPVDVKDGKSIASWPRSPLAVVIRNVERAEVEIGLGSNLWRWETGVTGPENKGRYELIRQAGGIQFQRLATITDSEQELVPGTYRFSWYLAWSLSTSPPTRSAAKAVSPHWESDGTVPFRTLTDDCEKLNEQNPLLIDLHEIDWHPSLVRRLDLNSDGARPLVPCLVSNGTIKRLKKVIRQLARLENRSFPIVFRGLIPGVCAEGRHVGRKQDRQHWDMVGILQFCEWTRKVLGEQRVLEYDRDYYDCPSTSNLFATADFYDED